MNVYDSLCVCMASPVTRDNTANMTRILEDQKRGGTPDTKPLTLKILVAKHNILTLVAPYGRNRQQLNQRLCAKHNTGFGYSNDRLRNANRALG